MEVRKDFAGGEAYASRNYNDLSETLKKVDLQRSEFDWQLTLRLRDPKKQINTSVSDVLLRLYPDIDQLRNRTTGQYEEQKYTPNASSGDALDASTGRCPGKEGVSWQYHLRGDSGTSKWNRYHGKGYSSFDVHLNPPKPTCPKQKTSPTEVVHERFSGSLPPHTLRENATYQCKRLPGCEGSSYSQWHQLLPAVSPSVKLPGSQRRKNAGMREALTWATTLRGQSDNRFDDCLVEMRGTKPWHSVQVTDQLQASDPKINFVLTHNHILPGPSKVKPGRHPVRSVES